MKIKSRIYIFLGAILLLVGTIIGCDSDEPGRPLDPINAYYLGYKTGQSEINNWRIFEDNVGSTIILPVDWTIEEQYSDPTVYNSPIDSAYVVTTRSADDASFEKYFGECNSAPAGTTSLTFTNEPIEYHGLSGRVIEFTSQGNFTGMTSPSIKYSKQLFLNHDHMIYSVQFHVQQSEYSQYSDKIDRILFSFQNWRWD